MKKFLTLATSIIVALVLASCSGGGQKASGSREAQPVPAGDWKQPYETLVNITAVKAETVDIVYESGDSSNNNPWTRAWKDELGIEVTYDWVTLDQYTEKVNLAIASGNLPDVFQVNYRQFRQLLDAGLIQDITEPYQQYTSQRIRDYEKTDPDTIKTAMKDGRLYGVPGYYYGSIDNPRFLWVRKDWYEAAGSPAIKTVADFENLARVFMRDHGGYGLATSNNLAELFHTGPMFDTYLPEFWYKDSTGRIKAGITHPQTKTALEYWARWYKEGILNPDFANTDFNKMQEDVVNGKTGMTPWWQFYGMVVGPSLVSVNGSDNAYMIPLPFPTVDGSQVMGQVGFPNGTLIVVSKNCANPAAVMKLISYTDYVMFDPDTVLTDAQFRGFTEGAREGACSPFESIDPNTDMTQYEHVSYALKTGDTSQLFTSGMKKKYADSVAWIENRNPSGLGSYLQQGFDGSAYAQNKFLLDNGFTVKTDMWGPAPADFDQTVNTFDSVVQGFAKIIMGQEPLDSYDRIIAEWYKNGGQIMEDAVNRDYNR